MQSCTVLYRPVGNTWLRWRRVFSTSLGQDGMTARCIAQLVMCMTLLACGRSTQWSTYGDVSPDGSSLLYSDNGEIYYVQLQTGREAWIVAGSDPVFAGSAGSMMFAGPDGVVWLCELGTGASRRITVPSDGQTDGQIAYRPRSRRVFFARMRQPGPEGRFRTWDIYSCDADGSHLIRHTFEDYWSVRMSSQPFDNGHLWFVEEGRLRDGPPADSALCLAKMDLAPPYALTYFSAPEDAGGPAISPGGRSMLVSGGKPGQYGLMSYDIQTHSWSITRVAPGLVNNPLFSKNGSEVIYLRKSDGAVSGWSIHKDGRSRMLFEQEK